MAHPLLILSPFPTVDSDGALADGFSVSQPSFCTTKCQNHVCRTFGSLAKIEYETCPHGFTVASAPVGEHIVRVNGVIEAFSNRAPPEFKRKNKNQKLKAPEFEHWV